jgi:uncharacterized membrane protein
VNDEITKRIEDKRKKREAEDHPAPQINRTPVVISKVVWIGGAILIDVVTGYAILEVTRWWYALIWVLAGAGGLILSEWQRERIGNNRQQRELGEQGVLWSAIAIVLMAIAAGVVYLLNYTNYVPAVVGIFISIIVLGCWHIFRSYRYHIVDDEYIERTREARDEEEHKRAMREIDRAAREAELASKENARIAEHKIRLGTAFDVAYGSETKKEALEKKQDFRQPPPQ